MAVILRDVAAACGCDVSTVSRALREDPRVARATRTRVQAAARRLGYRPNLLARQLQAGRTGAIWLVLSGIDSQQSWEPAEAASRTCSAAGYDLHVLVHHEDPAAHQRIHERVRQGLCDALLVVACGVDLADPAPLCELAAAGFPLAFLDRHLEGIAAPTFTTANAEAAFELVRRCAAAGAQAVLVAFGQGNTVERTRMQGVRAAARSCGLPLLTEASATQPVGTTVAVIGLNDGQLQRMVRSEGAPWQACRFLYGLFDGYQNEPLAAEYMTVCTQDFTTMASAAADYLLARCAGAAPQDGVTLVPVRAFTTLTPTGS